LYRMKMGEREREERGRGGGGGGYLSSSTRIHEAFQCCLQVSKGNIPFVVCLAHDGIVQIFHGHIADWTEASDSSRIRVKSNAAYNINMHAHACTHTCVNINKYIYIYT
jgi:hypothetical protein